MLHENHLRYFFSIHPFWDMGRMENFIRSDHISVSEFRWIHDVMSCVPGNGQLGIMLSNPEDFSGYCFGVADCRDEIPLYGMTKGYFIRFSPGAFSAVFKIPSVEIPARGIELSLVLPQEKLEHLCGDYMELADTSSGDKKHNMGIGLIVCRDIIKVHGGNFEGRNQLEGGTEFWFTLPLKEERQYGGHKG